MMHGGGETRHLAWARELQRAGDEVTIVTGRPLLAPARFSLDPEHRGLAFAVRARPRLSVST
jgi:hypothetical protein